MLIDSLAGAMLLATDEPAYLTSLLSNIGVWAKVAIGIGFVIFVHELGHFAAAKTFGVKCEKFYVGFDVPIRIGPIKFPRTFGKFTYGETEYGIGIIPLGGYVKMLGQDDDPRKMEEENERIKVDGGESPAEDEPPQLDPRSYPAKPVWQRMIIISAGVVMNVITGVLFAAIAFGYGVNYTPAIVGGVTPGGPAWQAGIEPGGQVMAVADYQSDTMHFREMRSEIFNAGIANPDAPIEMAIKYDDGVRQFSLVTQPQPEEAIIRLVGVSPPLSTTLSDQSVADPEMVAAAVLSPADAGGEVIGFADESIDFEALVPSTPLWNYLFTHPTEPVRLRIRRTDNSEHTVEIPPQPAKSLGLRFSVGSVVALVAGGPAEQAGMQVGDQIVRVGDSESPDPFQLATDLVGARESISVTISRDGKQHTLTMAPSSALQTVPPTRSISGEIAINRFGFAYRPIPLISDVLRPGTEADGTTPLQPGDTIKKVQLMLSGETPPWLDNPRFANAFEELKKGWSFSNRTPLTIFRETIQALPAGTPLRVHATRPPEGKVVTSIVTVEAGDGYLFERGLGLVPTEAVQQAESVGQALTLGIAEGKRRFMEVMRFLRNLPRGRIKLRHVGGPVAIVDMAKSEAEKGISPQLMFLTLLSMNLAILNFLPIPALDGGHMVFLLYELIAGKRANEQLEFRLTVAGLLTLLTLMVVVFANDIMRYL